MGHERIKGHTMNRRFVSVIAVAVVIALSVPIQLCAQDGTQSESTSQKLVPRNLLKLLHAPEVHAELNLTESQVESLEGLFGEIDPEWFRSRNLPSDRQLDAVKRLEGVALDWLRKHLATEQRLRARQLLYRSQGVRMLLNLPVQKELGLTESQIEILSEAAGHTVQAEQNLMQAMRTQGDTQELQKVLNEANEHEQKHWLTVLDEAQKSKVQSLLGKEFDTQSLTRIYPMAPELIPAAEWINSQPLTLESLRGKVVLLHFYAFQCHNCHANFGHYSRWHDAYENKRVVVLGIQTPETPDESDPEKVRAAAKERGLKFPILVDLGNKNWDNWSNTMWPTVYVIDQKGYLRHWWQGELNWQGAKGDEAIDKLLDQLLEEGPSS